MLWSFTVQWQVKPTFWKSAVRWGNKRQKVIILSKMLALEWDSSNKLQWTKESLKPLPCELLKQLIRRSDLYWRKYHPGGSHTGLLPEFLLHCLVRLPSSHQRMATLEGQRLVKVSRPASLIDKKVVSGRIERDFRIWSARLLPNAWSEAWSQVYIMQNTSVSDCAQQFSKNSEIPSKRWLVSRLTHCRRLSFSLLNRHTRLVQETCTLSFLPKITMRGIHQAPGVRAFGESSGPQAPRYIEVIKSLCASCSRNELPLRYLRNDRYGICGRILRWMVWSEWFALPVGYRRVYAKKRRGKEDESWIMLPSYTVKGRRHDCNRGMMIVT